MDTGLTYYATTFFIDLADAFHVGEPQKDFTLEVTPLARARRIGRVYYSFQGKINNEVRLFEMFLPMDRRQARRVSRKLQRKFRIVDGKVVFDEAVRV